MTEPARNFSFPHPCVRCGVCCLSITCEVGQQIYGIGPKTLCPGLMFGRDLMATCSIAVGLPQLIGVGYGCCIKARAYKDGVEFDVAALEPDLKFALSKQMRASIKNCGTGH